jgi:hypothetical protein
LEALGFKSVSLLRLPRNFQQDYCIRPDLIDGETLARIGDGSGRTRQHIHKLASDKASGMMGTTVNLTMGSLDD